MTLVAGFCGAGGLVMLADSEETTAGYAKRSVQKIEVHGNSEADFVFCMGGSGDAAQIDNLISQLRSALNKITDFDLGAIHRTVSTVTLEYFQKYI